MWWRAVAVWVVIIGAETVHGILRMLLLQPLVGDFRARQLTVFTGSLIIVAIAYVSAPWLRLPTVSHQLGVGCLWVVLTVLFEIGLGRYVLHLSWERTLSDYDISQGGLLLFGLFVLVLAPLITARLRHQNSL